jgi:hypothetical protein
VSRGAALLLAAFVVAGCGSPGSATSNGFSAAPPDGWKDETDTAETRTGTEFEAVWDGGSARTLTVSRVKAGKGRTLDLAAAAARVAVDRRFEEADPTPIEHDVLAGEPARRFEYATGDKRAHYVTARHGAYFYAVTMQAPVEGFDRAMTVLADYLAGWRWD